MHASHVCHSKEDLWPHVREFADRAISHIAATLTRLHDIGEGSELYAVHGHYADAGEAAALIAATLGCDMALTGHSLGRNKKVCPMCFVLTLFWSHWMSSSPSFSLFFSEFAKLQIAGTAFFLAVVQ